jgi:2-keto-4-pentenoate hydratase/2-oxohepta-3-ene-1,7-dioic acid hydratase in catechol pathway
MRFIFFDDFKPGVVVDETVWNISSLIKDTPLHQPQEVLKHIIENDPILSPKIKQYCEVTTGTPLDSLRVRPPVPKPVHLLGAMNNYKRDGRFVDLDFFLKSSTCVIGPGDTVELPELEVDHFAHEAELAVVIKKHGKKIKASEAMDYVFGYTGFIDVSSRGVGTTYFTRKSFDTFGPMGPVLVTADEISDPHDLGVKLWVNDSLRQDFRTTDMAIQIPQLIEEASTVCALEPGDVISSGTHHLGLGPIKDNDKLTLEIERIGKMTVHVTDPKHRTW